MDFLTNLLNNFGAFLAVFIGFCFLIFVHELGHYWAAKLTGVKVLQFAIGMGPAVFSWRKGMGFRRGATEVEFDQKVREHLLAKIKETDPSDKTELSELNPTSAQVDKAAAELGLGECEYRLSWVPLGGYVKMLGQEDLKPEEVSADPRSYNMASGKARAFILVAGVTMNLITGLLLFIIAFLLGVAFPPAYVGQVGANMPAAKAIAMGHADNPAYVGLKPGDKILKFNDEPIGDFNDFAVRTALSKAGSTVKLTIERDTTDGKQEIIEYLVTPEKNPYTNLLAIGVAPPASLTLAQEPVVTPDLKAAGIEPGMTITHVNNKPVTRVDQLDTIVEQARGNPVAITFTNNKKDKIVSATITPEPILVRLEDSKDTNNYLGVLPLTQVLALVPKSPAMAAGIEPGDIILQINSKKWPRDDELTSIIRETRGQAVDITVERDGKVVKIGPVTPRNNMIGVHLGPALDSTVVAGQVGSSGLASLNMPSGSRIVSVGGVPVKNFGEIQSALVTAIRNAAPEAAAKSATDQAVTGVVPPIAENTQVTPTGLGSNLTVPVEYQSNILNTPLITGSIVLTPELQTRVLDSGWNLPLQSILTPLMIRVSTTDPIEATIMGFKKTHIMVLQTYVTIQRLLERSVPISEARGPVGIVSIGTQIFKRGWTYYLFFLALISVNLVVMNLLPIPILDGGQLLFLAIEKIKGSPVSIHVQTVATYVGLLLLGALMLTTLYFDIARFFN